MSSEKKRADREDGFKQLVDLLDPNTHCLVQLHRLRDAVFAEGALSGKHKHLIALAMAVGARCDALIDYYVDQALCAGSTREEILEAVNLAVFMGAEFSALSGVEAMAAVRQSEAKGCMNS